MRMPFSHLLLLLLAHSCCAAERTDARDYSLVIGVRSEAKPFSYKLPVGLLDNDGPRGPLARAGYGGYMIRICDAVLAEMMIPSPHTDPDLKPEDVKVFDLDTTASSNAADKGQGDYPGEDTGGPADGKTEKGDRFEHLGTTIDILCDPATITNYRRELIVSPPLFLSGIGYLSLKNKAPPTDPCGSPEPGSTASQSGPAANASPGTNAGTPATGQGKTDPKPALIGAVKGTTASSLGIQALVRARELPQYQDQLVAYLRAGGKANCQDDKVLVKQFNTHQEAAERFCAGASFFYYLGDLEIIRTYAESIPGCAIDNGAATYTNDRYAIFGKAIQEEAVPPSERSVAPEQRRLLVARFFEILSQKVLFNPSVLDKAYADTFAGKPQSRKLKAFFWYIRGEPNFIPYDSEPEAMQNQQKDGRSQQ